MSLAPSSSKTALPHFDIATVLRPTERVSVSIPCRVRTDDLAFHKAEAGVVLSNSTKPEQAAVFVLVPSNGGDTRITHLIPISPSFRHSLNQTPPSPSTSFFHQSSRPHITLTLWNEDVKVELRISSTLTVKVQALIAELRRLVELSRVASGRLTYHHSWTKYYPIDPPSFNDLSDDEILTPAGESSTSGALTPSSSTMSIQTLHTPMTALTIPSEVEENEEERYPNPFREGFSRTAFLRKRLFSRQDKWSSKTPIRIRLGTYNVNDKLPPPNTTELIAMVGNGEEDLLVFGLQEVDLRSQALLYSQGMVRAEEWEAAILRGLKEKARDFERIALIQYVGVVTIVFVRKTLRSAVARIETSERGIGLLGFGGNKAGVCVRLKIHDSTLCFVNSHLAAFATALERRRADYQVLLKTLTFPRPLGELGQPAYEEFLPEKRDALSSIEDAHVLFWVGDLNYRVDMEDDILRAWVDEQRWQLILAKDQLVADIANAKSFVGFQEHPIDFPPSFKYVLGSSTLDTKRSPAYTDRVLYSIPGPSKIHSPPTPISCQEYTSHEIFWSDHRPVTASYTVEVRVADEEKRREEYISVGRELERLEEVFRPSLEIDPTNVDFGDIRLGRPEVRTVMLRNKGRVPASFNFKPPSFDKPICKTPIWPFPACGVVEPGEEAALRITICPEESWAKRLTLGDEDLNDVLVLQVSGGKDTFITIQATFLATILTLPLSFLTSLPDPIRSTPLSRRKELANPAADPYEDKRRGQRPVKELWRLLEYLMTNASGLKDLWTVQVDQDRFGDIIERLDTGKEIPTGLECVVARTILYILGRLPTPIVGTKAAECQRATDRDEAFAALEGVEQANTNVLIGLMSVVRLCAGLGPSPKPSSVIEQENTVETSGDAEAKVSPNELNNLDYTAEGKPKETSEEVQEIDKEKVKVVDCTTVEVLVEAIFGDIITAQDDRKRFVRLMLEG